MLRHKVWSLAVIFVTLSASRVSLYAMAPRNPPDIPNAPRTLIRNASLILTIDSSLGEGVVRLIKNSDVLLEGDRIAAIGKHLHGHRAQVVDATGKIVRPGFVDVHNHLWQSLIRGYGLAYEAGGWLNACSSPLRTNPALPPPVRKPPLWSGSARWT